MGTGVVVGVAGWATWVCWPTSSKMRRDTAERIHIRDVPRFGRFAHSFELPPFCMVSRGIRASQTMPSMAGFQVRGNTPRGLLNHGVPTVMILNLPGVLYEVGSDQIHSLDVSPPLTASSSP